ncbi:zinc ribbon domain-containing protein [Methanonatronarchaeum sp. AMET-Sl]|uniref:zinc ribbon domain-containing protein n=1 Tax=Methanonatronarchaeum sp. AMET-Sl TaxID=3037654 RepID=UPI00244E361C|nr:zinc ribbon domain-containing protein [Methanonatronarchaeum sp. AMET-Sl]WGI17280.1 zinc ribbon domain-containing protein [Methanonatronarchaeum sp. AMET-Sl]
MSEYVKTVKIPIHHLTTDKKLSYLNNLTGRQTYAVQLFCERLNENDIVPKYRSGVREFSDYVREETGLSAGFIQQAEDKVLWMYKQYKKSHDKWEWALSNATEGTRWYKKLEEREPSVPDPKKSLKKIPTPFDNRTGEVQKTDKLDLTEWVAHISTLKKGETIDILLNPSDWHKEQLEEAEEIKTFEIVHHPERECEYIVHIVCKYKSDTVRTGSVCGVDLGIKRDLSAVLIDDNGVEQFTILQNDKSERLKELDDRISHLRREEKYEVLKKLRNKRERVAEDYDRKMAKQFAELLPDGTTVFFGNPRDIRYNKYKGNGDKAGRKLLQHWSFSRIIDQCVLKLNETGKVGEKITEWNTSRLHYKCNKQVKRPYDDSFQRIKCSTCDDELDAEFNASVNIAVKGISQHSDKSIEPRYILARYGRGNR